jgi:hypothetical protein
VLVVWRAVQSRSVDAEGVKSLADHLSALRVAPAEPAFVPDLDESECRSSQYVPCHGFALLSLSVVAGWVLL